MSHSSGGVGGFGVNSASKAGMGPQVTDRLKLLKQKQNSTQSADKPRRDLMEGGYEEDEMEFQQQQYMNNQASDRMQQYNAVFNTKKLNFPGGPIRALHHQDDVL
jgi:hypothetical protein